MTSLPWLEKAARLKGKALAVALAVRFKAGVNRQNEVRGSTRLWLKLGIERKAAYRGLRALEQAGLVRVERHAGRAPKIAILEHPSTEKISTPAPPAV